MDCYELAQETERKLKELKYPKRVYKPSIPNECTSETMREFANKLEQYEADIIVFNEGAAKYCSDRREIMTKFKRKLFELYSDFSNEQLEVIYEKAYDENHSDLTSVASSFDNLVEFVKKLLQVNISFQNYT